MLVSSLRLLYVGPYNSPHFEDLALAMKDRGHLVRATGAPWGGGLPKDNLTKKGVRVDALPDWLGWIMP